jgi:hypothetical protein
MHDMTTPPNFQILTKSVRAEDIPTKLLSLALFVHLFTDSADVNGVRGLLNAPREGAIWVRLRRIRYGSPRLPGPKERRNLHYFNRGTKKIDPSSCKIRERNRPSSTDILWHPSCPYSPNPPATIRDTKVWS